VNIVTHNRRLAAVIRCIFVSSLFGAKSFTFFDWKHMDNFFGEHCDALTAVWRRLYNGSFVCHKNTQGAEKGPKE